MAPAAGTRRLERWQRFGLEALDGALLEDRKWQTRSFQQEEVLLPPHGSRSGGSGPVVEQKTAVPEAPGSQRRLIAEVTKCLDVLGCEDVEVISKTARLYAQNRDAVAFEGAEEFAGRYHAPPARREPDECTVRVSNLADSVTEGDLELLFNRIGDVSRAFLVCSRETQLSRGFAFVSFRSKHDATRAIERLHGKGLAGCVLTVEPATRRE